MAELNFDGRFEVKGSPGVAYRLLGYGSTMTEERYTLVCDHEDCPHDDPACYVFDEPEEIEDRRFVRAVMVGDDHVHTIDVTSLTEIHEGDYCRACGQIGCTADGR